VSQKNPINNDIALAEAHVPNSIERLIDRQQQGSHILCILAVTRAHFSQQSAGAESQRP